MHAFPCAAWGDISGANMDAAKAVEARKVDIGYAEKKPVWQKIHRWFAKQKGWKVIKTRWIDINKRR